MSSNDKMSLENVLVRQVKSLAQLGKIIIPFQEKHICCEELSHKENIVYLDLANYNAIEEYLLQDQLLKVQTGIKLKDLNRILSKDGKFFPVYSYNDDSSLLDIILTGEAGPFKNLFGGLRRQILGLENISAIGELFRCGGKVVKNVAGYDLTRFLIGSYGYYALPVRANLRLYALPEMQLTVLVKNNDWQKLLLLANKLNHLNLDLSCLYISSNLADFTKSTPSVNLLCTLIGKKAITETNSERIVQIFKNEKVPYEIIDDLIAQDELLQKAYYNNVSTNRTVEVSFSKKDIVYLLDLIQQHRSSLSLDILDNTIRFHLQTNEEQNLFMKKLFWITTKYKICLTASYSDSKHIKRIDRLGYDTSNIARFCALKEQLKNHFDPMKLFNPYVDL